MTEATSNIDLRLLNHLTDLVVCSRCFRAGRLKPVVQIVSERHRPRTLCRDCDSQERRHDTGTVRMLNA